MANDVARLMDHLKIEKVHVVGSSMGAGIALSFAVHYPERVRTATALRELFCSQLRLKQVS